MTAPASSSSAIAPPDPLAVDLVDAGRLPPLAAAFLRGDDLDLLAPLRFQDPSRLPAGPPPRVDRAALAGGLGVANAAYGHPRAEALARRLADPATRVVVTGQQPGLFGGPLLALTKMLAAVRWAEAIEAAGEPAVAVFWVATEDHDWAESSRATFPGPDGPRTLDLGEDPAPLLPLGMRTFGPRVAELEAEVAGALGDDVAALLARLYRPDARFGEAFPRLYVELLGERCPLFLDAMLPAVKRASAPHLRRLVEARAELDAAYARADARIEGRGYPLQVRPQPGLSPLFLLRRGERRRIEWADGDRFRLRGGDGETAPVSELLQAIADNPGVVSPGVLARPAIQDAILGTSLQVMGPAETSYLAQAAPSYAVLGLEAPATALRPQALVVEERQAAHLAELGVGLGALLARDATALVAEKLGDDRVGPVRERLAAELAALEAPLGELDPGLLGPLGKTRENVDRALETLTGKVAAATARRHEVWTRRLEAIRGAVLPGGAFQERSIAVPYFVARFGPGFATALADGLGRDPRRLHVLRLAPASRPPAAVPAAPGPAIESAVESPAAAAEAG